MNGFQSLWMQHYFPQMTQNGMDNPFPPRGLHNFARMSGQPMGGNLPPQGYDSSGINPQGMYTGGNLPAQGMQAPPFGGNGPMVPFRPLGNRGFNFFGGGRPPSMGNT